MNITAQNIIDLVQDNCRNQSLYAQSPSQVLRQVDAAADFVLSQAGIPSQEFVYTFDFDETQNTYELPDDFDEPLYLRYSDDDLNRNKSFSYRPVELLHQKASMVTDNTRLFGVDSETGAWRLNVLALNSTAAYTIDTFDTSLWTASNDAENVATDSNVYKEGAASMSFDITPGLSVLDRASLSTTVSYDLHTFVDIGHWKMWVYLPNITNLTSLSLTWQSSVGNYYKRTVTTQEDGTALIVGWNKIDFTWLGATLVGSPDSTNITTIKIDLDYTAAYTGGINFRFDFLRIIVPDQMTLNYRTRYKGKSSAGAYIYNITAATDYFLFGAFDNIPTQLIALQASKALMPQLMTDNSFIKEQYEYYLLLIKRKYPRKRINNLIAEPKLPNTD